MAAHAQRVRKNLAKRRSSMIEDLRRLVAIPTGHNHTPGLDEIRGILTERLAALGAQVRLVPGFDKPKWLLGQTEGRIPPSAVCRKAGTLDAPRILFAGHMDTVFAPTSPFREMQISADAKTATGPGVVDMKGGLLVVINALEALAEEGVGLGWTFVLTSDEETGSYHSEHVLVDEAKQHDVGLVMEPALPGGELAIERLGSGQFMLEAVGRSAHVGRDFVNGVSAVTALAKALVRLAEMPDPAKGRILSVGPLEGGDATNAVPDSAAAWGNCRFPDQETADEIAAMLDSLAIHGDGLPRVIVEKSLNRPAKPVTPEVERLALLAREVAESLGQTLPFAKTGGVCDGNILQSAGLPTIDTLGVRGGGLHTPQEWIELDSLVERSQLMACLLLRLAEGGLERR